MQNTKIYLSSPAAICSKGETLKQICYNARHNLNNGIKQKTFLGGKTFFTGVIPNEWLKPTGDIYDMRSLQILDAALEQIKPQVQKLIQLYGKKNIAICVGSCDNGAEVSFLNHEVFFKTGSFPATYSLAAQSPQYPAYFTAKKFGTQGISIGFATACASSNSSIIKAAQLLKAGLAEAVIAGGVDVASNTATLGFDSLASLSHEPTNPFSKNRCGITLGEGAAFFLMTKDTPKDDTPYIELAGYGQSCDAFHQTAPKQTGELAMCAMQEALDMAGVTLNDIDYLNLHGTGTILNDKAESTALNLLSHNGVFCLPHCSSTKSFTGHTLGAAGALEVAICFDFLMQDTRYFFPPQIWDKEYDDNLPPLPIANIDCYTQKKPHYCMSNSFAFGGCNTCLVIKKE